MAVEDNSDMGGKLLFDRPKSEPCIVLEGALLTLEEGSTMLEGIFGILECALRVLDGTLKVLDGTVPSLSDDAVPVAVLGLPAPKNTFVFEFD